jgi:hypothetical protein
VTLGEIGARCGSEAPSQVCSVSLLLSEKPLVGSATINASPGADTSVSVTHFWDRNFHQLLDIDIHQVNRRDFAGVGSDAHDKILADAIALGALVAPINHSISPHSKTQEFRQTGFACEKQGGL